MNSLSSLSSLHFLASESPVRPQSKEKDRSQPIEEKRNDNAGAFKDFPDYSRMNTERHNASRSDTFRTIHSPKRQKQSTPAKISNEDFASLNSSYFISAIRSDVREIGKEFKAELHEECQQVLALVKQEVRTTLDVVSDTSESTIGVVMMKLKEDIHKILSDAGWPLKVDFTPMQDEIRVAGEAQAKNYREQMQQLADHLGEKIAPVANELLTLRGLHDQLMADFEEAHQRISQGIRAPVADIAQTLQKVHDVQQEFTDKNADLEERLEAQVIRHVREQPVNVDFNPVLNSLGESRQGTSSDFTRMHTSMDTVQKDLAVVRAELAQFADMKRALEDAPKGEVDTQWTQTDSKEMINGFAQTDDKFWKAKVAQKTKTQASARASTPETNQKRQRASQAATQATKGNGVFVDADIMKKKARQALIKTPYNVHDYYYSHGIAQKIAKSHYFENFTFVVVFVNALWISIDADHNDADMLIHAHPVFIAAENMFCGFFTFELIVRFLSFKWKRSCLRDGWFVFDLVLVSLMALETWVMSAVFLSMGTAANADIIDASILRLIRIVKILRLSRLARLMRAVPEIIIFLKGIGAASRSVAALFGLWLIIIYVFAVFFVQTAEGDLKAKEFENVPTSMNTLLLDGILPDTSKLVYSVSSGSQAAYFWPIIVFFVLLASITLSYMLVGVLVQIVQVIAGTEKERAVVGTVASHLRREWQEKGHELDALLSKHEFQHLLIEPQVALFLNDVGVDMLVLVDMSDMIYDDIAKEHCGISFEHFVEAVLNMRGTNPVTVQDVKSQLRIMKRMMKEGLAKLEVKLNNQFEHSNNLIKNIKHVVLGDAESEVPDVASDEEDAGSVASKELVAKATAELTYGSEPTMSTTGAYTVSPA